MSEATEKLNAKETAGDDARAAYEAVRGGGAGLLDVSARGRVEVGGAEAVQFLNGMITNDVKALGEGRWMRAAFPNVQGRLLASARVLRRGGGDEFLFDTEPATRAALLKTLERFTLAGDFRVRDVTDESACLSVQGARASEVVREVFGDDAATLERWRVLSAERGAKFARPFTILRDTHTAEDGFDVFLGASDADALRAEFVRAGARPVGADVLEVLRVEAGVPRHGVDVDESNVVLEALPAEAVSFTKGCYVGQEIIARIHWRGHVAKKLTGLVFDADGAPAPGAKILAADADREAGRVTSVAYSPRLGHTVALAVVKYEFLKPGTGVRVVAGEGETLAARVAETPLVRGSWYEGDGCAEGSAEGAGES